MDGWMDGWMYAYIQHTQLGRRALVMMMNELENASIYYIIVASYIQATLALPLQRNEMKRSSTLVANNPSIIGNGVSDE